MLVSRYFAARARRRGTLGHTVSRRYYRRQRIVGIDDGRGQGAMPPCPETGGVDGQSVIRVDYGRGARAMQCPVVVGGVSVGARVTRLDDKI